MLANLLTGNIPILIVLCVVVYMIYYLHKRIMRLEGVFKRVNEINHSLMTILERNGVNPQEVINGTTQQKQVEADVEQPQSQPVPQQEAPKPSNPLSSIMSGLSGMFGGLGGLGNLMQQAQQSSHPHIEEIQEDDEESESDEEEETEIPSEPSQLENNENDDESDTSSISDDESEQEVSVEEKQHFHEESENSPQVEEVKSEQYTEEKLGKMNMKELHDIAEKYEIVFSKKNENGKQVQKNKKELISEILSHSN